ncbi:hypothetical protein EV127DRAFT_119180 [Xylaria flabelliformis]|nr:hypothetical protein EV127DRAFT_119180 [Xylaria flabelliformis]
MKREAPITTHFLPTAVLWRLQSKAFWHAPVDGRTAFRFPRLFTSVMQLKSLSATSDYEDVVVNPDGAGELKFSDVIARWNEQVQLWATRRPWYREAYAVWRKSAWGFAVERMSIERYIQAFKSRNELVCGSAAAYLQILLPGFNVTRIPVDNEEYIPKRGAREGPQLWLLHCLGYTNSIH